MVCEPLVSNVAGAGIEPRSTPEPALPSASDGSPLSVIVTVTESLRRALNAPADNNHDHDRTRSPAGSHSGSAATSPATHRPNTSTSTAVPGAA